ncbi:MAG: hypothetical protein ABIS50_21000 [Luteolibacter sp.]|uniref:hypothetical protein n=1 Tax=Luteolibacter sp. TaxID=1962973 RepID=UPI003263ED06
MKNKYCKNRINTSLLALALVTGTAFAGEEKPTTMAPAPVAEDVISGVLTLSANSHFISYGNDVWKDGSSMSDLGFNPSLEFTIKLPENFSLILGTWWDVNSKGAPSLGGDIQEIDVWAGIGYTYDKFSITTTYQAWNYNKGTEQILDVKLAYACFLSPSLTFHNRLDEGGSGGADGTIAVLGLSHSIEAGPFSISFPVNFAAIVCDNYYGGAAGSDSGYAYTSIGAQASYPLAFMGETYGKWALTGGLTQYWTNGPVIPGNPTNQFLTYNFGLTAAF